MKNIFSVAVLACFMILTCQNPIQAQTNGETQHQHVVTCKGVSVPPGKLPEFGCFVVASAKGLQFSQKDVYWHLSSFPTRAAAEAAKTPSGLVVEEEGKVWLSEFSHDKAPFRGGESIAVVGPLQLLPAKSYDADIVYAVLQPGAIAPSHTHAGPEAWYVISGEQCLETPDGTIRAGAGKTMFVKHSTPMELKITGTEVRRSLTLVIHDSSRAFGENSDWKATGACGK